MDQDYATRGKFAYLEDQTRAAIGLFIAGELVECVEVLGMVQQFLDTWMLELKPRKN